MQRVGRFAVRHTPRSIISPTLAVAALLVASAKGFAQEAPLAFDVVPQSIDSGEVVNDGDHAEPVYSTLVSVPGATWIRLRFGDAVLAGIASEGNASYLRITSGQDGAVQLIDAKHLRQWRYTSAYFNGDTVVLELVAYPGTGVNRITVVEAQAGNIGADARSICGGVDDRILSSDPRVARAVPVGCTAWLINDCSNCLLTAGHCIGSSFDVIEFNVPLSSAGGGLVHPPPQHQYAIDPSSIQYQNGGTGNDWAYFGCFDNSTTGMPPSVAQGAVIQISTAPPPPLDSIFRVTGFGTTSSPVSPTWNQAQKTHTGPLEQVIGTRLLYSVDTTGGNSGSPVFHEATGFALGIHTHAGCDTSGGNSGTSLTHAGFQAALANPLGVCEPGLQIQFPQGVPQVLDPAGGNELNFQVFGASCAVPVPGSIQVHCDSGNGFEPLPVEELGGNAYRAVFPAFSCPTPVRFYVTLTTTDSEVYTQPTGAPINSFNAVAADESTTIFNDNFQTHLGWLVQNVGLADGMWQRGVPIGNGANGDPTFDYDGSGACYLTDNAPGSSDVDGGPTRLFSPAWNLSSTTNPMLSYARWFSHINDAANPPPPEQDTDSLDVELSGNNGASWVLVERVTESTGWVERTIRIADYVPLTTQVRVRFSVMDNPNNSTTEAGIDAVRVADYGCDITCMRGDTNGDAVVDGLDVPGFVASLLTPPAQGTQAFCAADMDGDASLTLDDDAAAFVACLLAGGCE